MKSYLSLIPISARVRRKQSRMIILCIVLAVFLVTTIFSLAEAGIKMETNASVDKHGYWHISIKGIQESDALEIAERSDVAASSWYDVLNLDDDLNMDKEYYIKGVQTAICGIDEQFIGDIMHFFSEGSHVGNGSEVILTENAKELLGVEEGDTITLNTPGGSYDFVITGFRISGNGKYVSANGGLTAALLVKDDQIGAFMNIKTFRKICVENGETGSPQYYIQFQKHTNLKKAVEEIQNQYGLVDGDIGLNTILMAANGISNKEYVKNIYPLAGILFVLVLASGVLMISGSMNSNVAQRMQFFGMLRCIGASRSQIIRFVRLEALYWCRHYMDYLCGAKIYRRGRIYGHACFWREYRRNLMRRGRRRRYRISCGTGSGKACGESIAGGGGIRQCGGYQKHKARYKGRFRQSGNDARYSSCGVGQKESAADDGILCAQHHSVLMLFGIDRAHRMSAAAKGFCSGPRYREHQTGE